MRAMLLTVSLVLSLAAGVAAADEIVHFTNGTSMPVAGHEVEGEMIRVDLGDDDWLAFPRAQVERIEVAGRQVFPGGEPANRIVEGPGERSYPVRGRRPGRYNRTAPRAQADQDGEAVGTDPSGMPVYRPLIDSRNPSARQIGVTGHSAVLDGGADAPGGRAAGPRRTHQIGGSQRYDKTGYADSGKPQVTGLERRARPATPPAGGASGSTGGASGAPAGDSSGGSSGGDGS